MLFPFFFPREKASDSRHCDAHMSPQGYLGSRIVHRSDRVADSAAIPALTWTSLDPSCVRQQCPSREGDISRQHATTHSIATLSFKRAQNPFRLELTLGCLLRGIPWARDKLFRPLESHRTVDRDAIFIPEPGKPGAPPANRRHRIEFGCSLRLHGC